MNTETDNSDDKPNGYYYASGAYNRLSDDLDRRPNKQELVKDMIEHGWEEDESREAVECFWGSEVAKGDSNE